MKKRKILLIIASIVGTIALIIFGFIFYRNYKIRHELDDLSADNLLYLRVISNNADNHDEHIIIEIDFEKRTIIEGFRIKFDDEEPAKEVSLTEEQCEELKEYIVEYSHKVKAKEKEYWPRSYEYPPMFILFYYTIEYGEGENYKEYQQNGALCYPDDWDEFVEILLKYYYN